MAPRTSRRHLAFRLHLDDRTSHVFRNSRVIAFVGVFSALAGSASAQTLFQKTSGPGGGWVLDLVRQPDGDLFAAMHDGPIYRSTDDGWWWAPLPRSAARLAALPNGDLYALGDDVARSRDDGESWTSSAHRARTR